MTISRVLDKKKKITKGENIGRYHIKIRLTRTIDKVTTQKYFLTGVYATEKEFEKITGNPGKDQALQAKQTIVNDLYEKGKEILKHNPFIDFESFGNQLTSKGSFQDPLGLMQTYVNELDEAGRVGSRDYYKTALSCFQEYIKEKCGGKIFFATVTDKWLMRWEAWMIDRGRSITTVGMYAIAMRRVFNMAIRLKIIPAELYPFGEGKYVIPSAQGRKLALDEAQKNLLLSYKTLNIVARKGVDFWIFSYFCNGMNLADVCYLKFRDLPEGFIVFHRTKTKLTQRAKKPIVVISRAEVKQIIDTWGNKSDDPNEYVFPVLREGLTPQQESDRIHDFIAEINAGLKIACEKLKLPKITTYSARHTYATILKNKGASLAFLKESLGHADEKTTESYVDSFDLETKRKYANLL